MGGAGGRRGSGSHPPAPPGWSFQMGSAYQFHSWRVFVLVCAFPSVFAIGALTTMPESPRFFLEVPRGRVGQAGRCPLDSTRWGRSWHLHLAGHGWWDGGQRAGTSWQGLRRGQGGWVGQAGPVWMPQEGAMRAVPGAGGMGDPLH